MNRIQSRLQILRNRQTPALPTPQAKSDAEEATLYLYDVIDPFWGVSAAGFVKELQGIQAKTIHLRINSPGGDVFDGRAIATAIRQHPAKIIAHVDGMALSAASWIALAAAEVEIADGAYFMIHRAWAFAAGNAADMLSMAELLEKVDQDLIREYVAETGNVEDKIRAWLDAETWFNADEAVDNGFADRKVEAFAEAKNAWDLSVYDKTPQALLESAAPAIDWEAKHLEASRFARAL